MESQVVPAVAEEVQVRQEVLEQPDKEMRVEMDLVEEEVRVLRAETTEMEEMELPIPLLDPTSPMVVELRGMEEHPELEEEEHSAQPEQTVWVEVEELVDHTIRVSLPASRVGPVS
jgi:hypothetical protein